MSQINRIPRGLTGLLDIRAQGQTPREVVDTVQPTIELLAFYALEKGLKASQNSGAIAAIGQGLTIPVPSSEAWLIYGVGADFTFNGATSDAALSLRLRSVPLRGSGLSDTPVATAPLTPGRSATGAGVRVVAWSPGQTTIMPGGSDIRAELDDFTGMFGGMETMRVSVMYAQVGSFPGSSALFA